MPNIGTDILGSYDACPPPQVGIKRFVRKAGRGLKKGVRKAGRAAKKAGRVAVKLHTAPIKAVAKAGKFAAMKLAKVAALPIRAIFRKLAMRRARFLAYRGRRVTAPNKAEKAQGVQYAIAKMSRNPLGKFGVKILKFTKGATLGAEAPSGDVGLTGAEIAAAATAIIGAVAAMMKALNKPGEAPADPRAGSEPEAPAEAPAEEAPAEPEADADTQGALTVLGAHLGDTGDALTVLGAVLSAKRAAKRKRKGLAPVPAPAQRSSAEIMRAYAERPFKKAYRNRAANY